MQRIDSANWHLFQIRDIFITEKGGNQVPTGACVSKLELKTKGSTPRISVTGINNGILGSFDYVGKTPKNYRVYNNFVSVSFLGTVFYQEGDASLDMKVHCLKPKDVELNKYTGAYLVAVIKTALKDYLYSDQLSSTKLATIYIPLPSTSNKDPNWRYMEEYMRGIEQRAKSSLSALLEVKRLQKPIETTYWARFPLYSEHLFKIDMGSKMDRIKMTKVSPKINFVGRGSVNNGVVDCVDIIDDIKPYEAGCLTLSLGGSIGLTYIQEKPFYTSQNVCVLIPRNNMSLYCKRFISTMITCEGQRRYKAFVDELNRHIKTDFSILLPTTSDGEPNWQYMEMYMRGVEAMAKNKIDALQQGKQSVSPTPQTPITNYGTVNIIDNSRNYNIK